MPPASPINPQQASSSAHPDIRSHKRQRIAAVMATEGAAEPSHPAPPTPVLPVEPEAKVLPIAADDSDDTDSDQSAVPLQHPSLSNSECPSQRLRDDWDSNYNSP